MSSSVVRLSSLFKSKSTPVTNPLFKTLTKSTPVTKPIPTLSPSLKSLFERLLKEPDPSTQRLVEKEIVEYLKTISKSKPVTKTPSKSTPKPIPNPTPTPSRIQSFQSLFKEPVTTTSLTKSTPNPSPTPSRIQSFQSLFKEPVTTTFLTKSTPTPSSSLNPRIQSFVKEPVTTTPKSTPITPTPLVKDLTKGLVKKEPFSETPNFRDLDKTIYMGFKKEVPDLTNFRTDDAILEKTIYRLLDAKEYTLIHDLIEFQKKDPDSSREGCLVTSLISRYGGLGKLDEAQKLFDAMPERTLESSNALISVYLWHRKFDKAVKVFREMQMSPNNITYIVVMQALCQKGDLDSAEKMLDEMESNGFTPDAHTFNTLTRGFYSVQGRFDDGERVWTKMEKMGIKPNVVGYEGKLQGLLNEGKVSEAGKIFEEMKKRDLKPSVRTYNILLIWYCKAGLLDEAKGVYARLKESGNVPDRFTYEAIIPCCIDKGHLDDAADLSLESSHNCKVDPAILQSVKELLMKEKSRLMEELMKLKSQFMKEKSHLVKVLKGCGS